MSFLLLYLIVSTLIPCIVTLILRIFCIPTWIPGQGFIKIVNLVQQQQKKSPVLLLHNPPNQIIFYIIWDVISDITKKLFTLSASNL